VAGERRRVLLPRLVAVAFYAWQVLEHRVAGAALDQRPDRGALEAKDQVGFPVARYSAVVGLGGRPLISTSELTNFLPGDDR
jgi:hypothetical protein